MSSRTTGSAAAGRLLHDDRFSAQLRSALQQASTDKLDALHRVRLLNECLAQGGASLAALRSASPPPPPAVPAAELSSSDSDLSSGADSDLSEREDEGVAGVAALQAALQQQRRQRAALMIQRFWRGLLARREAAVRRQVAELARQNVLRRILAAAFERFHRQRPPANMRLLSLLRRRRHRWIEQQAARQLRQHSAAQAKLEATAAVVASVGGQARCSTTSAAEPPAVAAAPSKKETCSTACQTVCEVGCQTEPEHQSGEGPAASALPAATQQLGTPQVGPAGTIKATLSFTAGAPNSRLAMGSSSSKSFGRSPSCAASTANCPGLGATTSPMAALPTTAMQTATCSSPPTTTASTSNAIASPAQQGAGRSSSIKVMESVQLQVCSDGPAGSVASLAALQVCQSARERASKVDPGTGSARRAVPRIKSSRPASAVVPP